jgi:hypothetical protein
MCVCLCEGGGLSQPCPFERLHAPGVGQRNTDLPPYLPPSLPLLPHACVQLLEEQQNRARAEEACSAAVVVAEKQSGIIKQLSAQITERAQAWEAQAQIIADLKRQLQERMAQGDSEVTALRQQVADLQVGLTS